MRKPPALFIAPFIVFSVAALLAGCGGGRAPMNDPIVVESESFEGVTGDVSTTGLGDDSIGSDSSLNATGGDLLAQRAIYFEYDSSIPITEGEAVVQAHARYLTGVPHIQIILEGHADERGTREYNLALAEDRVKAVADIMYALGIDSSRIQTVSYGEERPVALGHDENAWYLNRRVEILYQ